MFCDGKSSEISFRQSFQFQAKSEQKGQSIRWYYYNYPKKRAGCFRQLNSLISTDFSYFSDLRSGVQIFNFGLTELVGEKEVNNMGRDSLL